MEDYRKSILEITLVVPLDDLTTVGTRADLVPLTDFVRRKDAAARLLQELRRGFPQDCNLTDEVLSEAGAMSAGFIIAADGSDLVIPQCCCSLRGLHELRRIVDQSDPEWKMIWIGHPWISARWNEGCIQLTRYHEGQDAWPELIFDSAQFRVALAKADEQWAVFEDWLATTFGGRLSGQQIAELANVLCGR